MVILGIDPGSTITGYAVLKKGKKGPGEFEVLDFGCVNAEKQLGEDQRLLKIYQEISAIIKIYKPDVMSIEKLFFFKNVKTVMPVSQTKGVILLSAALQNIP